MPYRYDWKSVAQDKPMAHIYSIFVQRASRSPHGRFGLRGLKNKQKHMVFDDFSRIQPLLFTLCSMLIKNGLKMSSRSLQERSKMPQDVQRPPTWGQHGPKMGPTWGPRRLQDRSKGDQIALPRGSPAQIALRPPTWTPHGPQMDPK